MKLLSFVERDSFAMQAFDITLLAEHRHAVGKNAPVNHMQSKIR